MIDLSGFEEKKKRDEEVQKAVQEIMNMPREELQEKMNIVMESLDTLMPFVECEYAAKRASDFIFLAKHGLMKKLTAYADTIYYAIKQEADNGNIEAQKRFEQLRILKQKAIRSEIGGNEN
jgi:hypothetical protein